MSISFYCFQACNVVPTDEGLVVTATTQWTESVQQAVAAVCGLKKNRYNMRLRVRKPTDWVFPTRSDTDRPLQPQKMARSYKFWWVFPTRSGTNWPVQKMARSCKFCI